MPFDGAHIDVKYGEPRKLFTAGPDDAEVQVSCVPYGAAGVSGGPNFVVGGPGLENDHKRGFLVTSNEFTSELAEGDELWVAAAEQLSFTEAITISYVLRSRPRDDEGEDGGDEGDRRHPVGHRETGVEAGQQPDKAAEKRDGSQDPPDSALVH